MIRFFAILIAMCLFCLTPHLAFAEYDEDECSGNSCDAPPENNGGAGGAGGDGGDASASNFGIQKTSATGGDASASNFGIQDQDQDQDQKTVVKIDNPADDVAGAAKEIRKGMERSAPTAPRPATAAADNCDTAGATIQGGAGGGGWSAPTFPCEILRTNQVKAELSGFWQNGVLRFLLNTRLLFKGIFSIVPIIGN